MKKLLLIVTTLLLVCSMVVFGAAPKKVAYVINGSLGDHAFYDSGYIGPMQIDFQKRYL